MLSLFGVLGQWRNWLHGVPDFNIPPDTKFSDIIVPTMDTIRTSHVLEMLLKNKKTVLCVGPTGTGKTLTIADKLTSKMPKEFLPEFIVFSAKTSANQTQDLIDGKLDKRRKGVFGPPLGKYFIFFIDDLNMPALEQYGAQPPIELIRQWMDFYGWYDRKAIGDFRNLVDVNFCCAMGPPGGGRNPITARLQRHFNLLAFTEMEDPSKKKIFGTILKSWMPPSCAQYTDKMVETCILVYNTIITQLLPTPAKSHYTFNLRDLSKVFQGMLMMEQGKIEGINDVMKLWYHESCRVFQDRLVNDEDRSWFDNLMKSKMKSEFNIEFDDVVKQQPLIFGDFMSQGGDQKPYVEITDHEKMVKLLDEYLEDYNQINTAQMKLVLFMDAVKHVSRISRIIRQPLGNALLLGMGGSGRQSLTRLAAHINEYDCFQIELAKNYGMTEWRDDLKNTMMKAGLENKPMVFLFSDTQIKAESFLEDLNNILNSGDVPNIYAFDDLENIYTAMKPACQDMGMQPTKTNLFSLYTKNVRSNLHTVITMSPLGEIFRARLRQFPALVNCCTIDWFSEWPADALRSVALRFLMDIPELETTDQIMEGLVVMCQEIQVSVFNHSQKFLAELSRYNYVTPTSYLELLGIFSKLVGMKKTELNTARNRLKTGLDKLLTTADEVAKLSAELETMKPLLAEAVKESVATMEQISKDTLVAKDTMEVVEREEAQATVKAKENTAIADDAQRDLNEALPALRSGPLTRPPVGVKMVVEAVCIMKEVKPKKIAGDKPGERINDYWDPGKALLSDPGKFLESLFKFDKDNIPDDVIKKIQPLIDNPDFTPAAIAKGRGSQEGEAGPAQADLAETQAILEAAKMRLHDVQEGIATLQAKYDDCVRKKDELGPEVYRLIGGLADEKDRWKESVEKLESIINNYLGDVLGKYRSDMQEEWVRKLDENKVPRTGEPTLVATCLTRSKFAAGRSQGSPRIICRQRTV
uniref:Dynein heavy chain 1, axonemal n=1 Tax=Magallana gigas TaxID=29159 RepID=A0A8W8J7D3_MAGGI